jgi:hypothetical protein
MLAAARRVVSPAFAILATATLAFHPTVVEYFRSFKQYGGEVAATSLVLWAAVTYLKRPEHKQFYLLLAVVVAAMTLSYPTVFLLPGLILVVALGDRRRALLLAGVSGVVLAVLYLLLVRPNYTPALRALSPGCGQSRVLVIGSRFCCFPRACCCSQAKCWDGIQRVRGRKCSYGHASCCCWR